MVTHVNRSWNSLYPSLIRMVVKMKDLGVEEINREGVDLVSED